MIEHLSFHINFKIVLSNSKKNHSGGILIEIALNLEINFGRNNIT